MTARAHESHSLPHTRREKWLDRFEQFTEWPLLALSVAIIPLVIVAEIYDSTSHEIDWAFVGISMVFALDLAIRTGLADHRAAYLVRNWPDVVVVVVAGFASAATLLPNAYSWFGLANVARGARALRILRLTRAMPFVTKVSRDGVALLERRGLLYVLLAFLVSIATSAGVFVLLEDPDGSFYGLWSALYWAIGTTTTVGGTGTPDSSAGKALAVFVMLLGITFAAWVTANVTAFLVEHGGVANSGVTLEEVMKKLDKMEAEIKILREDRAANAKPD